MGTAVAVIGHNRGRKTSGDLVLCVETGTVSTECRTLMSVNVYVMVPMESLSNLQGQNEEIWTSQLHRKTVQSVQEHTRNAHKSVFTPHVWAGLFPDT